ncbi:hypothetical protein FNV43_RR24489 [Rhamnella rubrinervis]|uniref:Uncharacterized protein n=1 Tax=Rhamnella rubrinervis TaxID=2594499 RepID=A0A8K0DY68_9ROSA|nr:hypothetical protein FNV43_RR24489 [Rhamnella rubrinervis]
MSSTQEVFEPGRYVLDLWSTQPEEAFDPGRALPQKEGPISGRACPERKDLDPGRARLGEVGFCPRKNSTWGGRCSTQGEVDLGRKELNPWRARSREVDPRPRKEFNLGRKVYNRGDLDLGREVGHQPRESSIWGGRPSTKGELDLGSQETLNLRREVSTQGLNLRRKDLNQGKARLKEERSRLREASHQLPLIGIGGFPLLKSLRLGLQSPPSVQITPLRSLVVTTITFREGGRSFSSSCGLIYEFEASGYKLLLVTFLLRWSQRLIDRYGRFSGDVHSFGGVHSPRVICWKNTFYRQPNGRLAGTSAFKQPGGVRQLDLREYAFLKHLLTCEGEEAIESERMSDMCRETNGGDVVTCALVGIRLEPTCAFGVGELHCSHLFSSIWGKIL